MHYLRSLGLAVLTMAASTRAFCYSGATSFETGSFLPDYTTTSGGVISHNMHFPGFSIVNDGTPSSPNTGVSNEDYPFFIAFNLASQGSSAHFSPAMQLGSSSSSSSPSFSLRTMNMACFEDKPGHTSSLPAVDCDITLTCYKAGKAAGSQVLSYTCGDGDGDCGAGLRNAPMQAAPLDVGTFACCQKIGFSATPRVKGANPVAVGLDTFSFYYTSSTPVGGGAALSDAACGC